MEHPLITTIIPTYKRPQLLKRAIASALDQNYPPIEVHINDDASEDATEEVVTEFMKKDSRVKYHRHPKNIGLLKNYQFSLSQVKTPYFSFLSDDDVLLPWFYEEVLKGFQQFPECAFSAGSTIIMSEKGTVIAVPLDAWNKTGLIPSEEGLLEMIARYPVPTSVLFHRKVIDAISIDMNNALTWDCDYLLQAAARYPIFISKRPCAVFLHHESSYSNSKEFDHWKRSLHQMIKRVDENPHLTAKAKKEAAQLINQDLKLINRAYILKALFSKKFKEAQECAQDFKENYGLSVEMKILNTLIPLCRWCPPAFWGLLLLRRMKKMRKTRQYNDYKQYLNAL